MDQSGNPEQHPSDELHDAAYPVSDYQPRNLGQPAPPDPAPGSAGGQAQGQQDGDAFNAKYTELAAPALAFTSGQASSSWHGAGSSHLDNALDPPPSYEQSQSHTQSRPNTSSQPSASNLPVAPPPSHNPPSSPSPEPAPPTATPLRPIPTYHPSQPAVAPVSQAQGPAPQSPQHQPPQAQHPPHPQHPQHSQHPQHPHSQNAHPPAPGSFSTSSNGAPSYGPMPAISYQKPERPRTLMEKLRQKSCYTTLLLIGVFLLALFVGLMIGFRDKLDDDEPEETRRPGSNQLYRGVGDDPPSETVTQTVVYTMVR